MFLLCLVFYFNILFIFVLFSEVNSKQNDYSQCIVGNEQKKECHKNKEICFHCENLYLS